ncbi:hypothetical protein ANOM_011062 [Aspergillus nomiae NRRL 13137]|uniref:Uncharacterized protein n=1 Tax=Aspergillus nomiae NRRL (strain ATCC 15546 / NRRL 13137 / CBS 260.88 / M93) TaxID=1509407 RepID=A0A0L1IQB6_ASPN3|nr:uncharacterized protein ANOM_011062 [Aspergillus nomiae NRRL 13137]KNG81545.1 hypothetical protein ANOM_011062 [Aspergillus nomiae NRRL 13137]
MARGLFLGKPRAPRETDISNPIFKHTDAAPRNDLKALKNGSTTHHRPIKQAHYDTQRPRTSVACQQDSRVEVPGPGFDFRIAVPAAEAIKSPTNSENGSEENMIGIALGSPRLVDPQNTFSQMQEKALESARERPKAAPQIQRKPSKWRKIGGLFKAKNAVASGASQPFYQVQVQGSQAPLAQGSSHSIDYQNREAKSNHVMNTEAWPCLEPEVKAEEKQQNISVAQVQAQDGQQPAESKSGPLLQVDIPSVEMERYSVMFSALLKQNEPSPLNRRSRTLENMSAPNAEVNHSTSPAIYVTYQILNPHQASPPSPDLPPPRRRATSPTRSNSPRLSLFPATHKSKASKVLGTQSLPRGPSPLLRNQVSRAESRQEDLSNEQDHILLMVRSDARSFHKPQDSVSSFISSTTINSDDEKFLLQKLKPVQTYVDPKGEPEWEIINKRKQSADEIKSQKSTPALSLNTQELQPEPANSESTASSPILSPLAAVQQRFSPLSPSDSNKSAVSPAETIRMPLANETKTEEGDKTTDEHEPADPSPQEEPESEAEQEHDEQEPEPADPLPTIEISIARSVSVSKRKQVLVPVGRRPDRLPPRARTPQMVNGQHGHRHGNSQDARIESV